MTQSASAGSAMTESRPGAEIELRGISKTFDGTRALRDVSLRLERGKIYALLGGNGSGKSTLIKILAAVYQADPGGTVTVAGESIDADAITAGWSRAHNLRFVHQDLGLAAPLSVVENMLAQAQYPRRATGAINWSRATKYVQERLDALDIDVRADAMMADLGPSKRTMVAIARALQDLDTTKPGVLVLDEPTAKLAAPEVSYLLERLQTLARGGLTIIYVSHRTEETLAIADEAIVLRDGQLVAQQPMAGLSESDLVRLVVGHPVDAHPGATRADRVAAREAQVVLQTTDLAGGALRGLSLTVCAGEVVGLAGLDGSGRTSLMKLVFGAEHPTAGHIEIRGHRLTAGSIAAARSAGIAYVPEDRLADFMFPTLSVADNAAAATVGRFRRPLGFHRREQRAFAERVIADFAVRTSSVDAMISSLSGGNQQKVAIARALATEPSLLLVDEPTQGVDVRARADLHKALRRAAGEGVAALVASADLNELCEISDRIIVLFRGKAIAERIGTAINPHEIGNLVYGGDVVPD